MRLKKLFFLFVLAATVASCTKQRLDTGQKVMGLTMSELGVLTKRFPSIKIDIEKTTSLKFNNLGQAISLFDSIKKAPDAAAKSVPGYATDADGNVIASYNICAYGYYHYNLKNGGMGSSFIFSVKYDYTGQVTAMSLSITGASIGWDWQAGTNDVLDINSGVTYGTAHYTYGIINYYTNYMLIWHLDPHSCLLTYQFKSLLPP